MAKKLVASEKIKSKTAPKFTGRTGFAPIRWKHQQPDPGFAIFLVGFLVSIFLSIIFRLRASENFYLGSPVGSVVLLLFWSGIGFLYAFWKTKDRKTYLHIGLGCSVLSVVLIIFVAIGGVTAYVAMAVCIIIALYLQYGQRHRS
jgi:Ca2+/Na+ antiporter